MLQSVEMSENMILYHDLERNIKGIILDHQEKKIIGNFPIPNEYLLPSQQNELTQTIEFPLTAYTSIEGTLIRVFYFQDEWRLSTSSKLNAFDSTWASPVSFGEQFGSYVNRISGVPLEVFLHSLDKSIKYFFILPTVGINRLGTLPNSDLSDSPRIYLVGVETLDGSLKYGEAINSALVEHNLWSYLEQNTFTSMSELLHFVVDQNTNIIIYKNDNSLTKIVSDYYKYRCDLRNNEIDLFLRYIQLLKDEPKKCDELVDMYPEIDLHEEVDLILIDIVRYIHNAYIKRYIQREYVVIPKPYYEIMKQCHADYRTTFRKTTPNKIFDIILSQDATIILSLIRNFSVNE